MWKVLFSEICENELLQDIHLKIITEEDKQVIQTWIQAVTLNGPEFIRKIRYWADHFLSGGWFGHRSSSFNPQGRIIYKIDKSQKLILVVRITFTHDYRRPME